MPVVSTHVVSEGKTVTIYGLPRRISRILTSRHPIPAYPASYAIAFIDDIKDFLLAHLGKVGIYTWRTDAESDESGLAGRLASIAEQLGEAEIELEELFTKPDDDEVDEEKDNVFLYGFHDAQCELSFEQMKLDAADLTHCCLLDEIEAVHYDLSCQYGETFQFGGAILHSASIDGTGVTVWEFVAMLEHVYQLLQNVHLIAALDKSHNSDEQRRAMAVTHDGRMYDYQLCKTYTV